MNVDLYCPRDGAALNLGQEHGIEVDRCPACAGAWYDYDELEALEATIASDDDRRGMIDYAKRGSDLLCPACKLPMHAFNYRAYNLEIDACGEGHGFWLDQGESDRIRDVMRERVRGLTRAGSAEKAWHRAKSGGGGGVLDSLKGLFRR
jgi:Zn-finger nucleic acid-binding protein